MAHIKIETMGKEREESNYVMEVELQDSLGA